MFSVNETPNAKVMKFCFQLMAEENTLVWNILLEELVVSTCPQWISRFIATPMKILAGVFVEID